MPGISELVRDFRQVLLGNEYGTFEFAPPATDEDLATLGDALGVPVPQDLQEIWGISGSGHWSMPQPLLSPLQSVEMSALWNEILSEWSPDADSQLRFGSQFVAFGTCAGGELLYLLDGPDSGTIGRFEPANAKAPTRLGTSLEHYLTASVELSRAGYVTVVTRNLPSGDRRIEPAWTSEPLSVPLETQRELNIGPLFY